MHRFAVIDDEETDRQIAFNALKSVFSDCDIDLFHSIFECLVTKKRYSLVILDVVLPGDKNGLEALERLLPVADYFLIQSHSPAYMEDAFDYKIVGYFKKSDGREVLEQKLSRIKQRRLDRLVELNTSIGRHLFNLDKIEYIEISRRDVLVHCEGDNIFTVKSKTLAAVAEDLGNMVPLNRKEAVNPSFVRQINDMQVVLFSGKEIKSSVRSIRKLRKAIAERMRI